MNNLHTNRWIPYILLTFGLLCIGWSAIFVKLANVSGFASAFYRMAIASIAILPIWLSRPNKKIQPKAIKAAALCGLFFACDIALWNTSIMLSKASIATLLANLSPVWVGLGAIFILKEKPKNIFWIGTAIAIIGVIFIIGLNLVLNTNISTGNLLAIGASIFYAAYLLTTQKVRNKLDTVSFTAISMITSTIVLLIICSVSGTKMGGFSYHSWLSLAGLGLVSQLGGWLAINWALGYIKSTAASVSLLSQSVVTAIIALPVLGETLSYTEIMGAAVVLVGVFLVNKRDTQIKKNIEPEYD
jgi:drug/metabolite transporter (DMT)-like permease